MNWPTAELHVHIEGTIESEFLIAAARRNEIALPSYDAAELSARYVFADLQSFLDVHYANLTVLRTERDFHDLAYGYLSRAAAGGVRRAEFFFDPQTHINNGVELGVVFAGLTSAVQEARESLGVSTDVLLSFLRDLGADAAKETLLAAMPFRDQFIGVALDSTEIGYPPSLFQEVYSIAAAEGLHRTAHAGEEAGPEYVWEALDLLGVERIDHGNRALEDPRLVERLRAERIPLTVCPLSNVALRTAPPRLADHPLRTMLDENLLVTISSDDPAYFGGYVDDNFDAIERELKLTPVELATLAANSFEAAFITDEQRAGYLAEVGEALATAEAIASTRSIGER